VAYRPPPPTVDLRYPARPLHRGSQAQDWRHARRSSNSGSLLDERCFDPLTFQIATRHERRTAMMIRNAVFGHTPLRAPMGLTFLGLLAAPTAA